MSLSSDIRFTARCAPFTGQPRAEHRVMVERDGTVRVYDGVAGHYTVCHSLTAEEQARLVRAAKRYSAENDDGARAAASIVVDS